MPFLTSRLLGRSKYDVRTNHELFVIIAIVVAYNFLYCVCTTLSHATAVIRISSTRSDVS